MNAHSGLHPRQYVDERQPSLAAAPRGHLPYLEPSVLLGELLSEERPLDTHGKRSFVEEGVECTELTFLSELHEGHEVRMHGWLCRPVGHTTGLTPVLVVPGGLGKTHGHTVPRWMAGRGPALILAIDWLGAGESDAVPGLDPWVNAMIFDGDYRTSYQFHNLRGLVRATELLLSQPGVDDRRLMAVGGSWGGFYSWVLAGIDSRFTHIFPTFGCGYLDTESYREWQSYFVSMGAQKKEEWLQAFDPGRRAHLIGASVFYQQATNDRFYSLVAGMETYRHVQSDKRLLLAANQDHLTHPFNAQDVTLLRSAIAGRQWEGMPEILGAHWVPGTNLVEVEAVDTAALDVSVVFSSGSYTTSFARRWRSSPVEYKDGRWVAEVPVTEPSREVWFYGHAVSVADARPVGASTPVQRVTPSDVGLMNSTVAFSPSFDFRTGELWELPVGDRHFPGMRIVDANGARGLAMRWGDNPSRRGVAYCLEGDLIAAQGYDGIEVRVRVPDSAHVPGLKLCLVTDFNDITEQDYVFDLDRIGADFATWQTVRLPFVAFGPIMSWRYYFHQPPLTPMDVGRLCGVGFYHPSLDYRGEAQIADITVVKFDAERSKVGSPRRVPQTVRRKESRQARPPGLDQYDLFIETSMAEEELRARLRQWSPWRHMVYFSNGVRTTDVPVAERFFVQHPLSKWHAFRDHLPLERLRGGHALDVGSNIGHYSLYLRRELDMDVVGLELNPRDLEVANFLLELTGLDRVRFLAEDANTFRAERRFDLILHLGTLDHFKDPFGALENAATMLSRNGLLALELQTYTDPGGDETLCKFQPHPPGSQETVRWMLGKKALLAMMSEAGFARAEVVHEWSSPETIGPTMRRLSVLAWSR